MEHEDPLMLGKASSYLVTKIPLCLLALRQDYCKSRSVHEAGENYLKTVNMTLETPAMEINLSACRGRTNPKR